MKKQISFFVISIVIAAAVGFLAASIYQTQSSHANVFGDFFDKLLRPQRVPQSAPAQVPLYEAPVDYEQAVIRAVERSSPAVISIIISKDLPNIERCPFDPFSDLPEEFRQFFGPFQFERPCSRGTRRQEVGGGSGFIVSSDGLIVTNKHVVADTNASYTVLTNDGKKYTAQILARDPAQDLAIVKINPPAAGLSTVSFADSDSIKLGQTAIAIGNALGEFRNTVSVGIVSGLFRAIDASSGGADVEHLEGLIQTDAAVNPGNSGGPLLNLRGEVIGINTAIAQGAENIGFAIPINNAKRDIESVKRTGIIAIPFLGVRYVQITEELARRDNLPVQEGVVVRGSEEGPAVIANSPAARAGIQAEDIIVQVNGQNVNAQHSLISLIQNYNVGDTITVKLIRAGRQMTIHVTLQQRPSQ